MRLNEGHPFIQLRVIDYFNGPSLTASRCLFTAAQAAGAFLNSPMSWLVVAPSSSVAGYIFATACLVPAEGSVLHVGFRGHHAVCRRPQKAAHEVSGDFIGRLWAGRASLRAGVNRAALIRATCAEMQTGFRYECPRAGLRDLGCALFRSHRSAARSFTYRRLNGEFGGHEFQETCSRKNSKTGFASGRGQTYALGPLGRVLRVVLTRG